MIVRRRSRAILFVAGLCLLLSGRESWCCNIPVFRYALERWKTDPTEIVIFHDGKLTAEEQEAVAKLKAATSENKGFANARVVDLVTTELERSGELPQRKEYADLFASLEPDVTLPYVVVRTAVGRGRKVNQLRGNLEALASWSLFESPTRKRLCERLLHGDAVVWLLLTSGVAERDQAAKKLMMEEFQDLVKRVELPDGIGLPGSELHSEVPLLVQFSVLEVDPTDVREHYLTTLLGGLRPDAVEDGQPLLVPVFGRGRALEVIPADQLDGQLVEDLTLFLSGACSCQVKEQNPGFDLLISKDWETELFGVDGPRPPPAKPVGNSVKSPQLLSIPPGRNR